MMFQCSLCVCRFAVVPVGGRILEMWLVAFAPKSLHRFFKRALKRRRDGEAAISNTDNEHIISKALPRFFGFVLFASCSVSQKALRQQFYLTFIAKYHGLSLSGINALSKFGLLSKSTFFHNEMSVQKAQAKQEVIR